MSQADTKSGFELGHEQRRLLNLLENTNQNLFITGKAGSGKSVLLEYFADNSSKEVAIVAPTGVAALNVNGQTIHSFFKLPPTLQEVGSVRHVDPRTKAVLQALDTLVIDEVSMVSVDLIEAVSAKLKLARQDSRPFGGLQLALFGDPYQLSPVVTDDDVRDYLEHQFGGHFFFHSRAYQQADITTHELQTVFRHKQESFKQLLNEIRSGQVTDTSLEAINQRVRECLPDSDCIILASRNHIVEAVNNDKLAQLAGSTRVYEAKISGDLGESSFPTEKNLKLKLGAQIMMLKNDTHKPQRWVNGSLGTVVGLADSEIEVTIDGRAHTVYPDSWEQIRYKYDPEAQQLDKEVVSSFRQLPVRLAWAVTIHKAQSQTYQQVAIDLSEGAFAHGQAYVALSRCTSLDGLYLQSALKRSDIIVDPAVVAFMKSVF